MRDKATENNTRFYNGTAFYLQYDRPSSRRNKPCPLRIRITPKTKGGQYVTKNMLGQSSKEKLAKPFYAKSKKHFDEEVFPEAAEEILQILRTAGLADDVGKQNDSEDLSELLTSIRDLIFLQNARWADSTKVKYSGQFDAVIRMTKGINISTLGNEAYIKLQEKICLDAAASSRTPDWAPGKKAPASARTRLSLLQLGIEYLQMYEEIRIPCDAKRYLGRKYRSDELLDLLENARFFPPQCLEALALFLPKTFDLMPVLFAIHLDTGLRISELIGLVWADVHWLDGSQGRMYYLFITGQLSHKGKRTSITKTDNAYRYVPLAGAIGTLLYNEYERLKGSQKNVRRCMIIHTVQGQIEESSPSKNLAKRQAYAQYFHDTFAQVKMLEELQGTRRYLFDEKSQNTHLESSLTPHSARRNLCSMLYAGSGVDTLEIFHQMGHDPSPVLPRKKVSLPGGKTDTELYQMCLTHEMHSIYARRDSLSYTLDGHSFYADIPASRTVLTVQPGQRVQVDVQDTQPGNQLEIQAENALHCQCIHHSSVSSASAHLVPLQFPQKEGQYVHPADYLPAPAVTSDSET